VPDLNFQIESAAPVEFAAIPALGLKLLVNASGVNPIHSIALRCQVQLEVTRRNYSPAEKQNLADLFGDPGRWGQTLRPMLWTHVQTTIPSFAGATSVELHLPCTFDFNVAATKYFYGLENGEIPLCLMFSGTIFELVDGALQVSPIPWDKEARFRLSLEMWRDLMDAHYPNTAWLCLEREAFDRLQQFKVQNGIATWEKTLDRLLAESAKAVAV
jgi:hypothetical protein